MESKHKNNKQVKLICKICGKEYYRSFSKSIHSKYCSNNCKIISFKNRERKDISGENNPSKRKEVREKISNKNKGKVFTEEHKRKISKNHANMNGKNNPMYDKRGKLAPNYGGHIRGNSKKREDLNHRVRSRWEANFARILIYERKEYKYEPKTFELSNETTYTPDFWIEEEQCWYEVKGYWNEYSLNKFNKFKEEYPKEVIKICDKNEYLKLYEKYKDKINWEFDKKGRT